jgi:hypothetical protein
LPDLKLHRGIKDIDQLYQILGYEEVKLGIDHSLHKYCFKNNKMDKSMDQIKIIHRNTEKPPKTKFHKLDMKITNDPSPIPLPEIAKYRKEMLDMTPTASEDLSPRFTKNSDDHDMSWNSINEELDTETKKSFTRQINNKIGDHIFGSPAEENYEASPLAPKRKINDFQWKIKVLGPKNQRLDRSTTSRNNCHNSGLLHEPDEDEITEFIMKEIMVMCSRIDRIFDEIYREVMTLGKSFIALLKEHHIRRMYKRIKKNRIFTECIDINLGILHPKSVDRNMKLITQQREQLRLKPPSELLIEKLPIVHLHDAPMLIENVYKLPKKKNKQLEVTPKVYGHKGIHLFILIHGLEGSILDMLPVKNEIMLVDTTAGFILPKWIKREKSRGEISGLGLAVADEIRDAIEDKFDDVEIDRISFICHSLGGIIAREAINHLLDYSDKFYCYCSFGTPHLGILNSQMHVKFGIWVSEIFKTYDCLTQLKMKDELDITDTYLYRLTMKEGLEHFEQVLFYASPQDTMCPYYSARVQVFKDDLSNPNTDKLLEMNQNIMNKWIHGVTRVDVDFNIEENTLSSMIGRTAHISFTINQRFLKTFVMAHGFRDVGN